MEVNMKKEITTLFLTLASVMGFAQDVTPEVRTNLVQLEPAPAVISIQEKVSPKRSFGYVKMGVSDSDLRGTSIDNLQDQAIPGFGAGYRLVSGASAIDFSASYNQRDTVTDNGREKTNFYTVPKVNYIYYINSNANNSVYAAGGAAWGGVKSAEQNFVGLIPNVALGMEFNRKGTLRSFIQLDVSQPAIAAVKRGGLPKTFAEISLGAGF
jgi:hypothetical protein